MTRIQVNVKNVNLVDLENIAQNFVIAIVKTSHVTAMNHVSMDVKMVGLVMGAIINVAPLFQVVITASLETISFYVNVVLILGI